MPATEASDDNAAPGVNTATIRGQVTLDESQIGAYSTALIDSSTREFEQRQQIFCAEVNKDRVTANATLHVLSVLLRAERVSVLSARTAKHFFFFF